MAYFFAGFLVLQWLCRFYSHFVWNYEVWEWKRFYETAMNDKRPSMFKGKVVYLPLSVRIGQILVVMDMKFLFLKLCLR